MSFCNKLISSNVEYGAASAAMASAPCCLLMFCKPRATYSNAVCQSVVCHLPPCFNIGAVKRSELFKPSYEKRSRSDNQHSLTASFSKGTTRITVEPFTCTTKFAPRLSCGLTDLRRESSHVRAL